MKKRLYLSFLFTCCAVFHLSAQKYSSVPIEDPVYQIIESAEMRGWIAPLPGAKPYSESFILSVIHDILYTPETADKLSRQEREILELAAEQYERKPGWTMERGAYYYPGNGSGRPPITIDATGGLDTYVSGGIYSAGVKKVGFDVMPQILLNGSLWDILSFRIDLFGVITYAPLVKLGTYSIGKDWSNNGALPAKRDIVTYGNYAYLPFSYNKKWDGSVYRPGNLSANGLENWPTSVSFGFGILPELGMGFFDNGLNLRAGRIYREWAAMDRGASLLLNSAARPFFGVEASYAPAGWFTLSAMTGTLEMPNMDIVTDGIYDQDSDFVFQNMYSVTMLGFDFKYVHFDLGTTVIWPKRLEIGYMFPLINHLFFQNNIGDNDNISLFGNIKLRYPGIGSLWFSLYVDEMGGFGGETGMFSKNFFNSTRQMYAYQFGAKASLPWIPFSSISIRYTKIEPYCYTHQVIKTPWYDGYISEAYVNNGESLGYYLPPNSDEVHVRFETMPVRHLQFHTQYQFIRHGADYGSRSVPGSSIYSELPPSNRDSLRKYFLKDGAYQWFHIIKAGVSYNFADLMHFPVTLYGDIGFVYSYFTDTASPIGQKGAYRRISTDEYHDQFGVVLALGVRIMY